MNKTTKFLYPFYSDFGGEFKYIYEDALRILSLYVADYKYKNYEDFSDTKSFLDDNIIFINISRKTITFEKNLLYIQGHRNYITDYEDEEDKHVIVMKVDEPHKTALRNLKLGLYSKMYDKKNIEKYFDKSKSYFLKYDTKKYGEVSITEKNCSLIIPNLSKGESFDYKKLKVSTYHVLMNSLELRKNLECLFEASIPKDTELMDLPSLRDECLNYEIKEEIDQLLENINLEQ